MGCSQEIDGQLGRWQATAEKAGQPLIVGQIGSLRCDKGELLDIPMTFALHQPCRADSEYSRAEAVELE